VDEVWRCQVSEGEGEGEGERRHRWNTNCVVQVGSCLGDMVEGKKEKCLLIRRNLKTQKEYMPCVQGRVLTYAQPCSTMYILYT
jgi:hypothetical protein